MTKRIQTYNSTHAAKPFNVKQLLRSALAVGVVAGFVGSASAQSGLSLPSFPTDSAALSLPVSQETSSPFAVAARKQSNLSASKRISRLLGLKKQTSKDLLPQSAPALTLPAFPSTCVPEQPIASNSHAPKIFRSTSGNSETSKTEQSSGAIVLASADESVEQTTKPSTVAVQTALALYEPTATEAQDESLNESLTDSLTESLGESLIDFETPKGPPQEAQQRLPELVRRLPAMQLRIGGGVGGQATSADTEQRAATSATFSLSDSSESQSPKNKPQAPVANVMNVRIEGEPMVAQAAKPTAFSEAPLARQKSSFEPTSRSAGHKSLSDKGTNGSPAVGERLEVGLHESTNVETTHPISGLSVEHPELCQVLKSGERSIAFVGLKAGQTRVALFTTNGSGERKIEIREVVIAGAENHQAEMKSLATEIGRSVHRMYPNSQIEVIAEAEGLTVQGYAGSEEEAKKIIGLVRRTSLQPVVDRLATYK